MAPFDEQPTPAATGLLSIEDVAALLRCSPRHVRRLNKAQRMPPPIRLGSLVRWQLDALQTWITNGCPMPSGVQR